MTVWPRWTVMRLAAVLAAGVGSVSFGTVACGAASNAESGHAEPANVNPAPSTEGTAARTVASGAVAASGARRIDADGLQEPLTIPVAQLDRVLQRGPGWLLRDVPLEPVLDARRQLIGFRIVSLWNGDPRVARSGVRPGDILRAINGVRIVTPDDLVTAFAKVAAANSLDLDLGRAGESTRVRIPIQRPAAQP
ncbi:MAG: hypothetical protein EXR79_06600 [Myxococcales bacterium]|nr:hypothetical protein [Myxococcales bacterium]